VSTLWTPYGEHEPGPPGAPGPGARAEPGPHDDAELAEELRRVREEIAAAPVADVVANHAVGLWQLAIVHLAPEDDTPPRLDEARLAIDAMAALVEGLGDRIGDHAAALRDALAQLRLAYVQASGRRDDATSRDEDSS
jgi:hypothetical protein